MLFYGTMVSSESEPAVRIALLGDSEAAQVTLAAIAKTWHLQPDPQARFGLLLSSQGLALCQRDQPRFKPLIIDFVQGRLAYRHRKATVANEALARAVGIKRDHRPTVLDATAGLGRDASILAALGCQVQMLERHPVVAALLHDGLQRAYHDKKNGVWLSERLRLLGVGSLGSKKLGLMEAEVVYLDPMFPAHPHQALVKKEMQILQQLVGLDRDADQLLASAATLASRRVVVKRPAGAPPLAGVKPSAQITTPQGRFDLYFNNKP
jgi:16S rRNA (guanine1516-N2)-methyltransferase